MHNSVYQDYIENWIIIMKQIPQLTKMRYDALLAQHQTPKKLHPYYLKWLR